MAKTSKLARNAQRKVLVQRYAPKRAQFKAIINNPRFLPKGGFFGFHLAHSCAARIHP